MQSLLDSSTAADDPTPALLKRMLENAAKEGQIAIVQSLKSRIRSFQISRDLSMAIAIDGLTEIYEAIWSVEPNIVNIHFGHSDDPITMAITVDNVPML